MSVSYCSVLCDRL